MKATIYHASEEAFSTSIVYGLMHSKEDIAALWTAGKYYPAGEGNQRSTSVGDIIEVDGDLFIVAPMGFDRFEPESSNKENVL